MKDFNIHDIQENDPNNDFYGNLRLKLMEVEQFPSLYIFKFIATASEEVATQIKTIFKHPSTKISTKDSKNGKYKSFTVETFITNADEVIAYYKEVSKIEKIIML